MTDIKIFTYTVRDKDGERHLVKATEFQTNGNDVTFFKRTNIPTNPPTTQSTVVAMFREFSCFIQEDAQ